MRAVRGAWYRLLADSSASLAVLALASACACGSGAPADARRGPALGHDSTDAERPRGARDEASAASPGLCASPPALALAPNEPACFADQ